jgi:hypothetical protein
MSEQPALAETPTSLSEFPIDIVGLEAWALMTTAAFEAFNRKIISSSNSSHYDKMVGVSYGKGPRDRRTRSQSSKAVIISPKESDINNKFIRQTEIFVVF